MSKLHSLQELGQSVWLDYLDRQLITSGELEREIERDGLRGMTSNPTIFQKAIASSHSYDDIVREADPSDPDVEVLERLMVRDIAAACDRFRPLYNRSGRRDGFVSIEVSPLAANDTARSIAEAHRLWDEVSRANVMVKIPGTPEGLPAIERCLADGININITLLFSVARYRQVAEAYLNALESRLEEGKDIDRIASVASFFVSRVDTKVDKALDRAGGVRGRALRGQIAIANAKVAYEEYERIIDSVRWRALAAKGAHPQRLLWASTSPKDPSFSDLHYTDALIGPDTIDTMTPESLQAFMERGHPEITLTKDRERAHERLDALGDLGIDLHAIEQLLEVEGVRLFADSFQKAREAIGERRRHTSAA